MQPPSTALTYDFMLLAGGAERVALELLNENPEWQLITGFCLDSAFRDASISRKRVKSLIRFYQHPALQAIRVMQAFQRPNTGLRQFDRVLFSGVYSTEGVHQRSHNNFYYCHTPPRFAYDLEQWYLQQAQPWQRPLLSMLGKHVRKRYAAALERMDAIATNSLNVQRRLDRHLGIEHSKVIYPPVDGRLWNWQGQEAYYLSSARLEPYKRVAWAIEAFRSMPDKKLLITSGGSQEEALRRRAEDCPNIRFTGWVSSQQLQEYVGNCIATLYLAKDEDFGLSPVESMAAGKPVIGVREGGLLETVEHAQTGLLLDPEHADDPEVLATAIRRLDAKRALSMRSACETSAQRFSPQRFHLAIKEFLQTS